MPGIGAGLRDHVDDAAARASDFGRVAVGVHLELLHRILAEAVRIPARAAAAGGLSEEYIVAVGAIDQEAIRGAALATEGKIAAAGRVANDAGRKGGEVEEVAPVNGQIADLLRRYGGAGLRTRAFDQRRLGRDADGLLHGADFKRYVNGGHSTDVQREAGALRNFETLMFGAYIVSADGQPWKCVLPGLIRVGRPAKPGVVVSGGYPSARDGRAGRVGDRSIESCAPDFRLREGAGGRRSEEQQSAQHPPEHVDSVALKEARERLLLPPVQQHRIQLFPGQILAADHHRRNLLRVPNVL